MSKRDRVKHEFVEFVPQELEQGTVYISGTYASCSHLCLCGCGEKVVTPLAPDEWHLNFDGETVSFNHSFGNWSFDCQSHYLIKRSRVIWAGAWSKRDIEANRSRDRHLKELRQSGRGPDRNDGDGDLEPAGRWRKAYRRIWRRG